MFKARDLSTGREQIILDHDGAGISTLRERGRSGELQCPTCRQEVLVKAGEINRPHYAHKHLEECPASRDSPELLLARAVLYEWLKTKFPAQVTIERQLQGESLPRAVDCWVLGAKGREYGYWIFDGGVRPNVRKEVHKAVHRAGGRMNVMFLDRQIRRSGGTEGTLSLTPTERRFLRRTEFDQVHEASGGSGKTLHYLHAEAGVLTTFRSLVCTEPPQQFSGEEIPGLLDDVRVYPRTGEFVHVGEWDDLGEWRRQRRRS